MFGQTPIYDITLRQMLVDHKLAEYGYCAVMNGPNSVEAWDLLTSVRDLLEAEKQLSPGYKDTN